MPLGIRVDWSKTPVAAQRDLGHPHPLAVGQASARISAPQSRDRQPSSAAVISSGCASAPPSKVKGLPRARWSCNAERSDLLSTRQYSRIVERWVASIGLDPAAYGTHTMRRTKATLVYRISELHSITRSARRSTDTGIARPSALAVLRLITNSTVFASSTGRSPAFVPFRIRCT